MKNREYLRVLSGVCLFILIATQHAQAQGDPVSIDAKTPQKKIVITEKDGIIIIASPWYTLPPPDPETLRRLYNAMAIALDDACIEAGGKAGGTTVDLVDGIWRIFTKCYVLRGFNKAQYTADYDHILETFGFE